MPIVKLNFIDLTPKSISKMEDAGCPRDWIEALVGQSVSADTKGAKAGYVFVTDGDVPKLMVPRECVLQKEVDNEITERDMKSLKKY